MRDCATCSSCRREVELVPWGTPAAERVQVEAGRALGRQCGSSRPRACTTSRSSARTGRRRSTSGRACSACRSSSSSRTSTTSAESHLYFDPGDGRLITVFTNEEREPDPTRTSTDIGAVHHIAFAVSQATFRQAVERLDERGIRHSGRQGPRLHGLDLLRGSARPADRARVVPLRAAGRLHACRRPARGAQAPRRARRPQHRPRSISPTRSRISSRDSRESLSDDRSPKNPY